MKNEISQAGFILGLTIRK